MADTLEHTDLQGKVTFHQPDEGWTTEYYEHELNDYVTVRGRAPQSVTMHPDTAEALGLSEEIGDPSLETGVPFLVTSPDYDRRTITLYF